MKPRRFRTSPRLLGGEIRVESVAGSGSIGDRWSLDVHVSHLITPDAGIVLSDPAAGQLTGSVHWRLSVFGVSATWRLPR